MADYFMLCAALFTYYAVLRYAWVLDRLIHHPCWYGSVWDAILLRAVMDHEWTVHQDWQGDGLWTQNYYWLECDFCRDTLPATYEDFDADELPF